MLALLSVSSEVQIIAYGPADATATRSSLAAVISRMVYTFWCKLIQVVLEKKPLNQCSSSSKFQAAICTGVTTMFTATKINSTKKNKFNTDRISLLKN